MTKRKPNVAKRHVVRAALRVNADPVVAGMAQFKRSSWERPYRRASKTAPGPWVVDVERAGKRKSAPVTMLMVVAERGGMPGLIVNQPPTVTPTDHANANLIAAAPDLLAACEAMFEARYSSWHGFAEENEPYPPDMQAAADAIKKARGQ